MVPAGARCGQHPEAAAVDLCKRCGKFLCGDCVVLAGEDSYCADCARRVDQPPSRRARGALYVASGSLAVIVLSLIAIVVKHPGFALGATPALVIGPGTGLIAVFELRAISAGAAPAGGRGYAIATLVLALLMLGVLFCVFSSFAYYWLYQRPTS